VTGATSPTGEAHPGTIEYDDRVEGRHWTRTAAEVPVSIAWVEADGVWKPVVRIEISGEGKRREIAKFGSDRALLEITTALV
jgi:hypothetical protein